MARRPSCSGRRPSFTPACRSKEQEKEGFSIPAQLKLLNEYAQANGFLVVREFVDVETAKAAGRTNCREMVKFLEANPHVKTLLVEKTDRLYRNFRDYVTLEDLDLEIHLVKEGEILSKDARSHVKFIPRDQGPDGQELH